MNQSIATRLLPHPLAQPGIRTALRRALWIGLLCWLIATLVPSEGYLGAAYPGLVINRAVGSRGFQLGAWEVQAWRQKIEDAFNRPGAALTLTQQHDLVVTYFRAIGRIDQINGSIERIYSDPAQANAKTAAAALQAELDRLRGQQSARRPAVERILQTQVSQMLQENGLLIAGKVWPPVLFHFSESPDVLILSPRNRIDLTDSAFVEPDAPLDQKEHMEDQVAHDLNVSTLVEGTGGFSAYPTMVVEYSDLRWVLSTIAHEWFHTYLAFYPLGWHYFDGGATRTMNETAASLFGDELGDQVLARYYPELAPPPPPPPAVSDAGGGNGKTAALQQSEPAPEPPFSFSATMRATRLQVDQLLAQGKIDAADAYMEAQRKVIVSHGYVLRKLNQAYFAFHGSYAVGPAATDPIGDKLRALRQRSGSLVAFVVAVRGLTGLPQLDQALDGGRR